MMKSRQNLALLALLEHSTIKDASEASGISQATIFRYLQDDSFQKAYREAKRTFVDTALTQLQKATGEAVTVLREIMNTKRPGPGSSIRVSAGKVILDLSIKGLEVQDLKSRLEFLEEKVLK